ncbi:MAG: ABC transporter ATP-binding protein [Caulobacteraceae bacterium]|nr:ABC transporter ATP-binding protein [Caulobacteraceae bacterium]
MTNAQPAPEQSDRALAGRLLSTYLRPRWRSFTVSLVCAAVVAGLSATLVRILDPAINDLIVKHKASALTSIPLTIAALAIGRGVAQVLQATLVNRIGNAIVGDIQVQLFGRLVRADLARLRAEHTGAYVASVLYDAGLIREAATTGVVNYTQNALIVAGSLAVMFYYDPWLAGAVVLVGPIAGAVMGRYSKRTKKAAKGAMAETSALASAIMESLDGVKIVKIENREAYEEQRVAAVVERRQGHLIRGANAKATAAPVSEFLMTLVTALVLAYAGWRASHGGMNIGALVAFMGALAMAGQSLRLLANLSTVMGEGLTAARRLFAAMDIVPEVGDAPGAAALAEPARNVRFEEVSFSYGDETPALDHVSLEAARGETVALVGPSGGGKSTILNLIPRFYDVTGGVVSIDGRDVRSLTLASLRRQIALVTQEPFLFDDTVRANIAYARPDASQAEIEEAARQAAAHDFIGELPKGYDTLVGEAGARLSGGQRQRIAIARAFLKNAPILLLDEATSALDTESEAQVQAALERLMAGRTTLLIAHRLSTVKGADRIYVIERGRVVETGTHAGLMRARGLYARLARSQDLETASEAAE